MKVGDGTRTNTHARPREPDMVWTGTAGKTLRGPVGQTRQRSIVLVRSSHGGTGSPLERRKAGLKSFDW